MCPIHFFLCFLFQLFVDFMISSYSYCAHHKLDSNHFFFFCLIELIVFFLLLIFLSVLLILTFSSKLSWIENFQIFFGRDHLHSLSRLRESPRIEYSNFITPPSFLVLGGFLLPTLSLFTLLYEVFKCWLLF